jgi:1,4-dihydroxy-6-naphthoate synthase
MFYALATRKLRARGLKLTHHLEDIQSLNLKAREGVYEITAISIAAYPYLFDRYRMMTTGASIGDGYGPLVVAAYPYAPEELKNKKIAVPGELTTAFLALRLLEPSIEYVVVPFDKILDTVKEGKADAGLIIHEGQLTFDRLGLHRVIDLGRWWQQTEKLPLPLGAVAIRRDIDPAQQEEMQKLIRKSVQYAMDHREEALAYALQFGRDLDTPLADKFVGMYVNEFTIDMGDRGREGIRRLLELGKERGLIPAHPDPDFV